MDLQLAGKRAIVTGGSSGIGWAICRQLAREGVNVAVCSRSLERATKAIADMGVDGPGRLVPAQLELRDNTTVTALVDAVVQSFGGIDIVVNCGAEVSGNIPEDFDHITDDFILHGFEDKFIGIMRMCRAVVPHMKAQSFGRIVNFAGSKSRVAGAIGAGARNTAVTHLTKTLSNEFGRWGITVNGVAPFTTVTRGYEARVAKMASEKGLTLEEHMEKIAERTAIGRLITADELAYFVAFLCSPLSVALTGEVLALTGGLGDSVYL